MSKEDEMRRRLADMFDDYEAEPAEQTWTNIRQAIQPERKRRPFWLIFWWGSGLVLAGAVLYALLPQHAAPMLSSNSTAISQSENQSQNISVQKLPEIAKKEAIPVVTVSKKQTSEVSVAEGMLGKSAVIHHVDQQIKRNSSQPLSGHKNIPATDAVARISESSVEQVSQEVGVDSAEVMTSEEKEHKKWETTTMALLPLRPLPDLLNEKQPVLLSGENSVLTVLRKKHHKSVFVAGVTVLSTFQLMEAQSYNSLTANHIHRYPTFDAGRLGWSVSAGYRVHLRGRSDLNAGMVWMHLPYRASYTVANTAQIKIEVTSDATYRAAPVAVGETSEARRLNWGGIQLDYGYTFPLLRRQLRLYAGGSGLFSMANNKPEGWARAGLEIPIFRDRFVIAPVYQYQFSQIAQSDHLLKTRLYTLGIDIKAKF